MSSFKYAILGGLLGAALLLKPCLLLADQPAAETLARGPLHEGYAEPMEHEPTATPVIAKQPPNPIDELPPDQKPAGDHVVWMPGYWAYDADREDYIWVSGFWRATPPGKVWMPGSWRQSDNGYQWVAGFWNAAQEEHAQVQYLPQPPKPAETGPATPSPTPTAVYVPGAWIYRDGRYLWRPGYWVESRPNWIWIPAHYRWTPAGYIYIDGYWDYALADRGMLFAPAYVPAALYAQQGYYYQPTVVVRDQCVFGAMFVRPGYGCYYFGDYFEPRYATVGFVSWNGYRGGVYVGGWYDPMYSYYRVTYRNDPYWGPGGGMVTLYVGRYNGTVARPPATLVQQNNIFVNNTTIINNTTVVNNTQMLTTVSAAAKERPAMKMEPVSMEQRQQHMAAAREVHQAAVHRAAAENKMVRENHGAMPRAGAAPRSAQMPVAKTFARSAAATTPKPTGNSSAHTTTPAAHNTPANSNTGHGAMETKTEAKSTDTKMPAKTDPKTPAKTDPKSPAKTDPKTPAKPDPKKPAPKHDPK